MGFFKALFGSSEPQEQMRSLSHPRDLRVGDIIRFAYLPQADVSNKQFEVTHINTYMYGDMCYPECVLKDSSGHIIYLMVEEEDGEEYIALSRKISKADIYDVMPEAIINSVKVSVSVSFKPEMIPEALKEWFTGHYKSVEHNVQGAFVTGDARYLSDEALSKKDPFSSYVFEDAKGDYALELEFYNTGENELCVTVYHGVEDIEEMWPSAA